VRDDRRRSGGGGWSSRPQRFAEDRREPPPPQPPPPPAPAARLVGLEEIDLTIDKLVAGGDGLGRFEGIAIFVPLSAPGDRLRVRLTDRRPDFGRAEIVEILTPGPGRRTPPCPHFAACGGCSLQHLDDRRQLAYKVAAMREALAHIGHVHVPETVPVIAGDAWGYRLRTQLHTGKTERGPAVGYHARGSRELVAVGACPVLVPELEACLEALPGTLGETAPPRLDLAAGDGASLSSAPVVERLPHGPIQLTAGNFTYRFDARCFFQTHRGLLPDLLEQAIGPFQGAEAFDLFAGVGLFTLPLARRYQRVVAVESERVAVRFARQNVRAAEGISRVSVENRSVEGFVDALPEAADRVLVDPPRGGLPLVVRTALVAKRPRRLTYISCHAATLARDLRALQHGFAIESLCFLDLFPQTGHLEAVVQMTALDATPSAASKAAPSATCDG